MTFCVSTWVLWRGGSSVFVGFARHGLDLRGILVRLAAGARDTFLTASRPTGDTPGLVFDGCRQLSFRGWNCWGVIHWPLPPPLSNLVPRLSMRGGFPTFPHLHGTHSDNVTFLLRLTVLQSSTKLMIGNACVAVCYSAVMTRNDWPSEINWNGDMTERLL